MKKTIVGAMFLAGIVSTNAQEKKDSLDNSSHIEEVELFGENKKQPKGLDIITRLPLSPQKQIQNISIISHRAIAEMGALTITDATKNIPGVVLFSNYGGGAESMSIRGYRGTPTLKNGVLMNSDFRRSSMIADMQGVESIQIIRGSAAITQGIGNALGAAGGVINIVTKTPKFINQTNIGFRYGSWDTFRPTLDIQQVLDRDGKIAVRLNVAYQKNNSFTDYVRGEKVYVAPSVAFRPDNKTEIILQMDYLNNRRTPNRGTVNLGPNDIYTIYDLPKHKFLGFETDYARDIAYSYMITADRKISEKFKIRAAYMSSDNSTESLSTGNITPVEREVNRQKVIDNYAIRNRSILKSYDEDHSKVFQVDFIGQEIKTGILKHTFQLGFDWKESYTLNANYAHKSITEYNKKTRKKENINYIPINGHQSNNPAINVTENVNNILPNDIDLSILEHKGNTISGKSPNIGIMLQEVMDIGDYVRATLGVRYSKFNGDIQKGQKYAWDPSLGIMISPLKNIGIYASYTTNTSLRGNNNPTPNGGSVGTSVTKQWEAGFKSDWFNEKLRFNANFYRMILNNLSYALVDANNRPIKDANNNNLYDIAGDLERKGIEIELVGKIIPGLEVMAGYAFLDAKYKNSPAFVNGSTPFMTAKHTANGWLNYTFREGFLKGLNFGGGIYYIGERPVNEYTTVNAVHDTVPGVKPFNLKAYTTINAQIGYTYKNIGVKVFANNLTDAIGYNAYYRGGFLNRNDPRNFAVQVNYKF